MLTATPERATFAPMDPVETDRAPEAVTIEAPLAGEPHRGRVLAAVFPHADDFPLFAGGTIAKLVREGYTAYLIRTSNDEMDSYDLDPAETALANRRETEDAARILGARAVYHLDYRNHSLDAVPPTELRHRLIALFRFLRVDTVLSFDPWGHYEENPDHVVTAQAVEAASWMAERKLNLPEHGAMGLAPVSIAERYYCARGPQLVNRVVDISSTVDLKRRAICACCTQIRHTALRLRDSLAAAGRQLPILAADGAALVSAYTEAFLLEDSRRLGQAHGLEHAEAFHYFGADRFAEAYVREHGRATPG